MPRHRNRVQTWKVYPRVNYFKSVYIDLVRRFRNVVGKYPENFQEVDRRNEIIASCESWSKSLEVNVFGTQNLDIKRYIVDSSPLKDDVFELEADASITLFICYIPIDAIKEDLMQCIKRVMEEMKSCTVNSINTSVFFQFDIGGDVTDDQKDKVVSFVENEMSHLDKTCLAADRICWKGDNEISKKISLYLESLLMTAFYQIYSYLQRFNVQSRQNVDQTLSIHSALGRRKPSMAMHALLFDIIEKIAHGSEASKAMEVDYTDAETKDTILSSIARMLKCNIVGIFSRKYKLPPWMCNQQLVELGFEESVKGLISEETMRYIITEVRNTMIYREREENVTVTTTKYMAVLNRIRWNISQLLNDTDRLMMKLEKTSVVTRKMMIEIEKHMEETVVKNLTLPASSSAPRITEEMRREIGKLRHVYSIATIFNEVTIHLLVESDADNQNQKTTEEKKEDKTKKRQVIKEDLKNKQPKISTDQTTMDVDEEDDKNKGTSPQLKKQQQPLKDILHDVRKEIDVICREYHFTDFYSLQLIQSSPISFAQTFHSLQEENQNNEIFEFGDLVFCDFNRVGTVGAFMVDRDDSNKLLAVTNAHVVIENGTTHISKNGTGSHQLGTVIPHWMIINVTGTSFPLIDFTAVLVNETIQPKCDRALKTESGTQFSAYVDNVTPNELIGKKVFKKGSKTAWTKGIIASDNFGIAGNSEEYLYLIEPMPGEETESKFADRGDSGSIVFLTPTASATASPNEVCLLAVSMIVGGEMKFNGNYSKATLSFSLKRAIDLWSERSEIFLGFP